MRKIISTLAAITMLFLGVACSKDYDLTVLEEQLMKGESINSITTNTACEIDVIKSDTTLVILSYSACLKDGITLSNQNGTLNIGLNAVRPQDAVIKLVVYAKTLSDINLNYGSQAVVQGCFITDTLNLNLSKSSSCSGACFDVNSVCNINVQGSSVLSGCKITCQKANIEAQDASRIAGTINPSASLEVQVKSGSRFVDYSASIMTMKALVEGGSMMNMTQSQVKQLELTMTASEASVNVSELIKGTISEASTLYYQGNPDISNLNASDDSVIEQLPNKLI